MLRSFNPFSGQLLATAVAASLPASALASPAYMKLGDIKGESTDDNHKGEIEVISFSFAPVSSRYAPQRGSAESGQPAGAWTVRKSGGNGDGVYTSDPQEGGEIAASEPGKIEFPNLKAARPAVSDIPIVKHPDSSTSKGMAARADPPPSGSLMVEIPAGTCVSGSSYPVVTLSSDAQLYRLQGVTVANCGPIVAAKGKKKQQVKLDYLKVEMKDALISGY